MGFLEDLLSAATGGPQDMYLNLSPEDRRKMIEARMRDYQNRGGAFGEVDLDVNLTPFGEQVFGGKPLGEYQQESFEKYQPRATPAGAAKEKIEAVSAQKEAAKQTAQAEAAETERMQKAAYERQLDPYSWLGGEGGADPAEKLQKLRRIREQAGGAGGGGTFSQQADSPELQARLRERDEWTAQQPMRDMEFLASAEQARRNPELAMSSAQRLSEMKSQQSQDRVIANQEALIAKLGKGGKVPFDLAMQLQASGMPVPFEMRGISPDRATQEIQQVMRGAQESIAAMIEDPSKMGMNGRAMISFLQWVIDSGPQFLQYAQENPDEALARYEQMAQIYAQQTGALAGMALGSEPQQVE